MPHPRRRSPDLPPQRRPHPSRNGPGPNGPPDDSPHDLDDEVLLELAAELRRLTGELTRGLRRRRTLPCLSSLTAMLPAQRMLTDALTARVVGAVSDAPGGPDAALAPDAGYL